jgi:hypothetical protein
MWAIGIDLTTSRVNVFRAINNVLSLNHPQWNQYPEGSASTPEPMPVVLLPTVRPRAHSAKRSYVAAMSSFMAEEVLA